MECGLTLLLAIELSDVNVDEIKRGQLLALALALPWAVVAQLVLLLALWRARAALFDLIPTHRVRR